MNPEAPTNQTRMPTREAAEFLGVSYQTLVNWRAACKGPVFIRMCGRAVRYERADLEAFLEQSKVTRQS